MLCPQGSHSLGSLCTLVHAPDRALDQGTYLAAHPRCTSAWASTREQPIKLFGNNSWHLHDCSNRVSFPTVRPIVPVPGTITACKGRQPPPAPAASSFGLCRIRPTPPSASPHRHEVGLSPGRLAVCARPPGRCLAYTRRSRLIIRLDSPPLGHHGWVPILLLQSSVADD